MPRASFLNEDKLHVAAGILLDTGGRLLLADRSRATTMREFWEFPGGKLLAGESAEDALRRELGEELGIEILSCERFHSVAHDYAEMHVEIEFFLVKDWSGTPRGNEGQLLKWLRPADITSDLLLPADAPVLERLRDL